MKQEKHRVAPSSPSVETEKQALSPRAHGNLYASYGGQHEAQYPGSIMTLSGLSPSDAWQSSIRDVAPKSSKVPLRVIHVTLAMIPAGIDRWLTALIRYADPNRIKFLRCVVTTDLVDRNQLSRVGVPVEIGGRDSIRRASQDCDILLISDPGDDPDWVDEIRPGQGVFVAHGDGSWTRKRMEKLAPAIDHVIAVSHQVQESICDGFSSTVITNGVDPIHLTRSRPLDEFRAGLGFQPSDFVVGFVGRFSPEKNPSAVIEALAGLPPHFKALMVGFGPLRSELIELANATIPGRFVFARGEEYLGDYYGAMNAFCMPSYTEGYGLAIMEAMMCGKPPIVSRVGFVKDAIIDRVNGLVVAGDARSIRDAAILLDTHREWAAGVGFQAAAYADRHGHALTMARRYAETLESLWAARSLKPERSPSTNGKHKGKSIVC
ncbi:glycosyltransferase family 4 protein [Tundrisphaera lichenicola]|uniref:glycosyltransferase family 4 protein n=1 Tax=Tundrisphaera lichenicola TaxID=2029860 RepID=UPI003EB6C72F